MQMNELQEHMPKLNNIWASLHAHGMSAAVPNQPSSGPIVPNRCGGQMTSSPGSRAWTTRRYPSPGATDTSRPTSPPSALWSGGQAPRENPPTPPPLLSLSLYHLSPPPPSLVAASPAVAVVGRDASGRPRPRRRNVFCCSRPRPPPR